MSGYYDDAKRSLERIKGEADELAKRAAAAEQQRDRLLEAVKAHRERWISESTETDQALYELAAAIEREVGK
jgi:hypothetical protein